ncbi:MAG: hypothetical protein N4A49_05835 [Marinifilaceae bacterium]|jgi:regulator of replication initiation timing|nr:hypothetical protein [Marinifilaceae bacterium]
MDKNVKETIEKLKESIKQLIISHNELKKKNTQLLNEKMQLINEVEILNRDLSDLSNKHEKLKIAKAISTNEKDSLMAKKKIGQIVREIDNCIALLNK